MVDGTDRIYETTEVRRGNLASLADLLERVVPPPEFDMSCYLRTSPVRRLAVDEEVSRIENLFDRTVRRREIDPQFSASRASLELYQECGTVACAAGHGPMAGVPARPGENWYDYTERCFTGGDNDAFEYMFGAPWKKIDNTPEGAAARIRRYLAEGTPDLKGALRADVHGPLYSLFDFIYETSYADGAKGYAMRQFLLDTYAEYLVIDAALSEERKRAEAAERDEAFADRNELHATVRKLNCDNADEFWATIGRIRARAETAEARAEAAEAERDALKVRKKELEEETIVLWLGDEPEARPASVQLLHTRLKAAEAAEAAVERLRAALTTTVDGIEQMRADLVTQRAGYDDVGNETASKLTTKAILLLHKASEPARAALQDSTDGI